jgi:hypothetical protein
MRGYNQGGCKEGIKTNLEEFGFDTRLNQNCIK